MSAELTRAARLLGSKGGHVTAQRLTPEERSASAQHAVRVRWARVRDTQFQLPEETQDDDETGPSSAVCEE